MNPTAKAPEKNYSDILPENKILGINGSPRPQGNSDILLETILAGAQRESVETAGLHLRDLAFQGCIGCEKCRKGGICTGIDDEMSMVYQEVISSRGIVLVSPTHNYNITSWMKAFIDRLYCFYDFQNDRPRSWSSRLGGQNRKAVIAAICEQQDKKDMGFTLEAMRYPLEALGYEIVAELAVFNIFDRGKVKKQQSILKKASTLGTTLAKAIS